MKTLNMRHHLYFICFRLLQSHLKHMLTTRGCGLVTLVDRVEPVQMAVTTFLSIQDNTKQVHMRRMHNEIKLRLICKWKCEGGHNK